ncbi:MAG: hypothetical protein NZ899_00170 [Thermoguttaceae bacterium]|nr:hypothetical protein [Thermoguttaceae bacterium]MDW8077312.1 hypothetical protein [Thermoguttaceae bacterium]
MRIPNSSFGRLNPYRDEILGDWLNSKGGNVIVGLFTFTSVG